MGVGGGQSRKLSNHSFKQAQEAERARLEMRMAV